MPNDKGKETPKEEPVILTLSDDEKRWMNIPVEPPKAVEPGKSPEPVKQPESGTAAQPTATPAQEPTKEPVAEPPKVEPKAEPVQPTPELTKRKDLYEQQGRTLVENAEYFKAEYEKNRDPEMLEKYKTTVESYNALKSDYDALATEITKREEGTAIDKFLQSGLAAIPKEKADKFEGYVKKAIEMTPYTLNAATTANLVWQTALNLAQAEALFPDVNKGQPTVDPAKTKADAAAAATVLKEIATPSGGGTNDNGVVDMEKIREKAQKGDHDSIQELLKHDPFYKEYADRGR